jgi:hypothetical protein
MRMGIKLIREISEGESTFRGDVGVEVIHNFRGQK